MGERRTVVARRAAAVGVLLLVTPVSAWRPAQAVGEPPAIPATVRGVTGDGGLPVEKALGVGAASVVVANATDVFVVTADDGAYHRLRLPGYDAALYDAGAPGVSLSPDGLRLAYAWHARKPPTEGTRLPSGIRVIDLVSGTVRSGPVPGPDGGRGSAAGVLAWNPRWSPDGRYLAFDLATDDTGFRRLGWFPPLTHDYEVLDTSTYQLAGTGPGGVDTDGRPLAVVVSSTGTVFRNGNGKSLVARTRDRDRRTTATFGWRSAQVTPDGSWMALSSADRLDLVLERAVGRQVGTVVTLRWPRSFSQEGALDLVGWTAPDQVLAVVHQQTGPSTVSPDGDLVRITLDVDPASGLEDGFQHTPRGRVEVVGRVTGGDPGTAFGFATDLAAADPPTREFDEPSLLADGESSPDDPAAPGGATSPVRDPADPALTLSEVLFGLAALAGVAAAVLVVTSRRRAR